MHYVASGYGKSSNCLATEGLLPCVQPAGVSSTFGHCLIFTATTSSHKQVGSYLLADILVPKFASHSVEYNGEKIIKIGPQARKL